MAFTFGGSSSSGTQAISFGSSFGFSGASSAFAGFGAASAGAATFSASALSAPSLGGGFGAGSAMANTAAALSASTFGTTFGFSGAADSAKSGSGITFGSGSSFSFGSGSGFSFGSGAGVPPSGSSLGAAAMSTPATGVASSATFNFNFSASAGSSAAAGFQFSAKPVTAAAAGASSALQLPSFGVTGTGTASSSALASTTAAPSLNLGSSAAPAGQSELSLTPATFSFGAPSQAKAAAVVSGTPSASVTPASTLPGTSAPGFAMSAGTSTAAPSPSATKPPLGINITSTTQGAQDTTKEKGQPPAELPSEIQDLKVDDIVTKWSEEIEELVEEFRKQAIQVGRWDRQIVNNEDRIVTLHKECQSLRVSHKELEMNLDSVLAQQTDLHRLLDSLDEEISKSFAERFPPTGASRVEADREKMHERTIALTSDLDAVSNMLKDTVEKINGSKVQEGDVMSQILSVMNAHLSSLQYLEDRSTKIKVKLGDLSRLSEAVQRETLSLQSRRVGRF